MATESREMAMYTRTEPVGGWRACWGKQTREPDHVWSDDEKRFIPRIVGAKVCTRISCGHCKSRRDRATGRAL